MSNMVETLLIPASAVAFAVVQSLPKEYFWEKLISYGALGVIAAYLLWERFHDRRQELKERKAERELREQANAVITAQTAAIQGNSQRIKHLSRLLYLVLHSGAGPKARDAMLTAMSEAESERDTPSMTPRVEPKRHRRDGDSDTGR